MDLLQSPHHWWLFDNYYFAAAAAVVVVVIFVVVMIFCASSKVVKEYTRRTDYIFQYTCQLIFHLTIHVGPTLPALNSHHSHKTRQIRPHWKCLIYNILVGEKNKLPKPQKRCLETCNTWLLSSSGVNVRPFAVSTILFERQTLSICWM